MEDWVRIREEGFCHPCLIAPVAAQYLGVLEAPGGEAGRDALKQAWESKDILTISKTLDTIKAEVGETLRNDLVEIDCFAQSYKDTAAAEQQQQ